VRKIEDGTAGYYICSTARERPLLVGIAARLASLLRAHVEPRAGEYYADDGSAAQQDLHTVDVCVSGQ